MILTTRYSNYNHTVAISNQTSTYAKKREESEKKLQPIIYGPMRI